MTSGLFQVNAGESKLYAEIQLAEFKDKCDLKVGVRGRSKLFICYTGSCISSFMRERIPWLSYKFIVLFGRELYYCNR